MRYLQLQAFISSRMEELRAERKAIRNALHKLRVLAWVYEDDAGAQSRSPEESYLDALKDADLFIGLFWKGYGPHTIEEYGHAKRLGKDCLIYEKEAGADRQPELQCFLEKIGGKVKSPETIKRFKTLTALREAVTDDVDRWRVEQIRARSGRRTEPSGETSQRVQYVDRPTIIAADKRAYEKIQEARKSFRHRTYSQACQEYLEAVLVAMDGLESEYDGILIEAKLCWVSDLGEMRALIKRIHEYLAVSKLKKHLDEAKNGLGWCQSALLESGKDQTVAVSRGLELIQKLISELYVEGLEYWKARTGVGIHALFEILEYLEGTKRSSEGLRELIKRLEKDDTKDRLALHTDRIREVIHDISVELQ